MFLTLTQVFYVQAQPQYCVVFDNKELVTTYDTEEEALAFCDCDSELKVVYNDVFSVLKTLAA